MEKCVQQALADGLVFRNLGYDNGKYRVALEEKNGYRHIIYNAYVDHRRREFVCYPPKHICRRNCSFSSKIIWQKFAVDEKLVKKAQMERHIKGVVVGEFDT